MIRRGLHLVEELSARRGSFRLPGALVVVVWCDSGQPLLAPASDARAWLRRVLSVRPLSAPGRPVAAVMPDTLTALGSMSAKLSGAGADLRLPAAIPALGISRAGRCSRPIWRKPWT